MKLQKETENEPCLDRISVRQIGLMIILAIKNDNFQGSKTHSVWETIAKTLLDVLAPPPHLWARELPTARTARHERTKSLDNDQWQASMVGRVMSGEPRVWEIDFASSQL